MATACRWASALVALLVSVAGCAEPRCGELQVRAGATCLDLDAGEPDQTADQGDDVTLPDDGGGDVTLPDDGGGEVTLPDDACTGCDATPAGPTPAGPTPAGPTPAGPTLQGTPSAAPEQVIWLWDKPQHTVFFELQLDGQQRAPTTELRLELALAEGEHTLAIRACAAAERCSDWVMSSTRAERFGATYGAGLAATRRALARTPLGHPAAVGCSDCALTASGDSLALESALARLSTAAGREADLLELNVALVAGVLRVMPTGKGGMAMPPLLLSAVLESTALRASSALLALELVETQVAPDAFADALVDALSAYPELMRNGRPLLVHADRGKLSYLRLLRSRLAKRLPRMAPYLRVWLDERAPAAIGLWQDGLDDVLAGVDGVLLEFSVDDLFGRLSALQRRGLGVGVLDVPGPGHGELVLAGLREEVDLFLTAYRADQARALIADGQPGLYASARRLSFGQPLSVHSWTDAQTVGSAQRPLGGAAPSLAEWGSGFALQGGVLDFTSGQRSLLLAEVPPASAPGTFFSLVARLDDLRDLAPGAADRTLLATSLRTPGGFSLELRPGGNDPKYLRLTQRGALSNFVVFYEGAHGMAGSCESKNGSYGAPLSVTQSVWLMGVAEAGGTGFQLFINGRCVPIGSEVWASRDTTPVSGAQPLLLGAAPPGYSGGSLGSFSKSYLQSVQVRTWSPRVGDEVN